MDDAYGLLLKTYRRMGGSESILRDERVAHLVIHGNEVYSSRAVEGLVLDSRSRADGVDVELRVKGGYRIEYPVHMCFGIIPEEGEQRIRLNAKIEDGAGIKILSHCMFPNAERIIHEMDAIVEIGDRADFEYLERHYHGEGGGIVVAPRAKISLGDHSRLYTEFSILDGRVGKLRMDYDMEAGEGSAIEALAKVLGYGDDEITIRERGYLRGRNSRGLIKSRIVVKGMAMSEVISELIADKGAEGARGHVDCVELVMENARARAIPLVDVWNERAKITHEASIGTVDKKQLNTLMSKGLSKEEAIDVIVKGYLR
jgi:Fe-S cluster assembly scaffold protein SufB